MDGKEQEKGKERERVAEMGGRDQHDMGNERNRGKRK